MTLEALKVGDKIKVLTGSTKLGVAIRNTGTVVALVHLGADYNHRVEVSIDFVRGTPTRRRFQVTNKNRLGDQSIRLHDGLGRGTIEVSRA